jgi:hypothetical protein
MHGRPACPMETLHCVESRTPLSMFPCAAMPAICLYVAARRGAGWAYLDCRLGFDDIYLLDASYGPCRLRLPPPCCICPWCDWQFRLAAFVATSHGGQTYGQCLCIYVAYVVFQRWIDRRYLSPSCLPSVFWHMLTLLLVCWPLLALWVQFEFGSWHRGFHCLGTTDCFHDRQCINDRLPILSPACP